MQLEKRLNKVKVFLVENKVTPRELSNLFKNNKELNQFHDCSLSDCKNIQEECYSCKNLKSLTEFSKDLFRPSAHRSACKLCDRKMKKEIAINNKIKNLTHSCIKNGCTEREKFCNFCQKTHKLAFFILKKDKAQAHDSVCRFASYAKRAKINFDVNTFESIVSKPCFYNKSHFTEGLYVGLDRQDNTKGYELENIVPCCWPCNHAKGSKSVEVFIDFLKSFE